MKLKPCPTCGNNQPTTDIECDSDWWIECPNCSLRTGFHDTEQNAKEAWNNRPAENELLEVLERFKETFENAIGYTNIDKFPEYQKIVEIISKYKGGDEN